MIDKQLDIIIKLIAEMVSTSNSIEKAVKKIEALSIRKDF